VGNGLPTERLCDGIGALLASKGGATCAPGRGETVLVVEDEAGVGQGEGVICRPVVIAQQMWMGIRNRANHDPVPQVVEQSGGAAETPARWDEAATPRTVGPSVATELHGAGDSSPLSGEPLAWSSTRRPAGHIMPLRSTKRR